jgi:bifunctional enzyme CysN/CysC
MASGASTASLALLVMDARKGVLTQTCRHPAISGLMGVRDFAMVVNKMDLVDFREDIFRNVENEFDVFLGRLGHAVAHFIPCCAPHGDNVVRSSNRTPWYSGPWTIPRQR